MSAKGEGDAANMFSAAHSLRTRYDSFKGGLTKFVYFTCDGNNLRRVYLPFLFDKGAKRVLVEGQRDAGKTTMLSRICREWAIKDLWHGRFSLIFYVRLDENFKSLEESAAIECGLNLDLMRNILSNYADSVLWLFDDEAGGAASMTPNVEAILNGSDQRVIFAIFACRPGQRGDMFKCDEKRSFQCQFERAEVLLAVRQFFNSWNASKAAITLYLCLMKTPKYAALRPHWRAICEPLMYVHVEDAPPCRRLLYLMGHHVGSSENDLYALLEKPTLLQLFCTAMQTILNEGIQPSLAHLCGSVVTLLLERAAPSKDAAALHELRAELRLFAWNMYRGSPSVLPLPVRDAIIGSPMFIADHEREIGGGDSFSHALWLECLAAEHVGFMTEVTTELRHDLHRIMSRDFVFSRFFEFLYGIGCPAILNTQEAWAPRQVGNRYERSVCAWLDASTSPVLENHLTFWKSSWQQHMDSLLWAAVELGKAKATTFFLSHGATLSVGKMSGKCAAHVALESSGTEVMQAILDFNPPGLREFFMDDQIIFFIQEPSMMALMISHPNSRMRIDAPLAGRGRQRTRLHLACEEGEFQLIELLVEAGASLGSLDGEGYTPLLTLIEHHGESLEVIKTLVLKSGPMLRLPQDQQPTETLGDDGSFVSSFRRPRFVRATPLGVACLHGHLELVKWLVARKFDVNQCMILTRRDGEQTSELPINLALRHGHLAVAKFLVANGANVDLPDKNGVRPICAVCQSIEFARDPTEAISLLRQLLAYQVELEFPLVEAQQRKPRTGDLDGGASPWGRDEGDEDDGDTQNSPLFLVILAMGCFDKNSTIWADLKEICKRMLEAGASANTVQNSGTEALEGPGRTRIRFFPAPVGPFQCTPWHLALLLGDLQAVQLLLSVGGKVRGEMLTSQGETFYHLAVRSSVEMVTLLHTAFPDVSILDVDLEGISPFQRACAESSDMDLLRLYARLGGKEVLQTKQGPTPWAIAASRNCDIRLDLLSLLLDLGANIDEFFDSAILDSFINGQPFLGDNRGFGTDSLTCQHTALHSALSLYSDSVVVQFLVERGADLLSKNSYGESCWTVACKFAHQQMASNIPQMLLAGGLAERFTQDPLLACDAIVAACQYAPQHYLSLLLQLKGCQVNLRSASKLTPLEAALLARRGPDVIKLLLEQKADVNLKGESGAEPIKMAAIPEVVSLLQEAGATGTPAKGLWGDQEPTTVHGVLGGEKVWSTGDVGKPWDYDPFAASPLDTLASEQVAKGVWFVDATAAVAKNENEQAVDTTIQLPAAVGKSPIKSSAAEPSSPLPFFEIPQWPTTAKTDWFPPNLNLGGDNNNNNDRSAAEPSSPLPFFEIPQWPTTAKTDWSTCIENNNNNSKNNDNFHSEPRLYGEYPPDYSRPVPSDLLPMGVAPPVFAPGPPSDGEEGADDGPRPRRGWSPHGVRWRQALDVNDICRLCGNFFANRELLMQHSINCTGRNW